MSAHSKEGHVGLKYAILICSHGKSICHYTALGQFGITSLAVPIHFGSYDIWNLEFHTYSMDFILCSRPLSCMVYNHWLMNLFLVRGFCFSRKEEIERTLWERPHRKNGFMSRVLEVGGGGGFGGYSPQNNRLVLLSADLSCPFIPFSQTPVMVLPPKRCTEAECTRLLLWNVNKSIDSLSGSLPLYICDSSHRVFHTF